ncbi:MULTISPECIES: LysE family translocator [unclassified Pseudomonas]|jgi:threonine/homoserine/homoserine lactone efflux protein|uniref:LysE family translocator n=1 Tax=unclassified Pseudomonas TaxID=196821 RepID=UPI000EA9BF0D|nr:MULTISPECIES: LysE family translocator [unclassified Pseudomonas]AYF89440.1 LysE family translocator [Pseudomonas sp. DY-1]MDH4655969.1 LysE family translocator [Pseudomonas sp. BN606]
MLALFLLVASTHFAALLSPGPDFFLLLRAGLVNGLRHADGAAAGIALANLLSMLLVLLALSLLPASNGTFWQVLQLVGGGYFIWIGTQALLATRELELPQAKAGGHGSWRLGFFEGLLASSLNPKLPLFYAGLFGVLRNAAMPGWGLVMSMGWMTVVVLFWDMALVRLLDHPRWRSWLQLRVRALDRFCGALLLALGGWLAIGVMGGV